LIHEDIKIREYLKEQLKMAVLDNIIIKRSINKVDIDIYVGKPGMVIGRGGSRVESIKEGLKDIVSGKMNLNVFEVQKFDLSARIVALEIAQKLERRLPFKKVLLNAMQKTMEAGAQGVKVHLSGRLGGDTIARTDKKVLGSVPTSTIEANIEFARETAYTNKGTIGVKVWIYKPEKENN
jgi:small subunit ribosomal protein S3